MRVYRLDSADNIQYLRPQHSDDWRLLRQLEGKPVRGDWLSVKVIPVQETLGFAEGDFPHLTSHVPVFSERAATGLKFLLADHGEWLPLESPDTANVYFAFNVTSVVDALDEERSKLKRFSDGRIMSILQYEFVASRVLGMPIFRIPQSLVGPVFVTDLFLSAVKGQKFTGFKFTLVWEAHS